MTFCRRGGGEGAVWRNGGAGSLSRWWQNGVSSLKVEQLGSVLDDVVKALLEVVIFLL